MRFSKTRREGEKKSLTIVFFPKKDYGGLIEWIDRKNHGRLGQKGDRKSLL